MIYNLKNNNYKDFDTISDNILIPRSYFIPFSGVEAMGNSDIRNERYSSDRVECLSGQWKFCYYEKCTDIPESFDSEDLQMDDIIVPSTWQFTGYEPPVYINTRYAFDSKSPKFPEDCPAGVYLKTFEIENTDYNYILSFLGVAGSLDLFCNSQYVGYSEGSHNTAEFELNPYLKEGKNEIVVVNHKWCNGTYLECQDMFRSNGIFRDVLLTKSTKNSIYDVKIKTVYDKGLYNLEVIPSFKLTEEVTFTASLYDSNELIKSKSVNVSPSEIDKLLFSSLAVRSWSAEIPNLYDLIITLSINGVEVEAIRQRVGFKHTEIKGNVFYFNNEKIKLLGVNHHDTNPKTGYVLTVDDMENDIKICKEFNVNCIRTSHYPPDPTFLDLCDEYGIYVIDEADIETHGIMPRNHISHDLKWKRHYWDRVLRMFQRDSNHASITMWSLGNEAGGYNNQDYCYEKLKALTPIPIHYEGACRTRRFAYDVISNMYPWPNKVKRIAKGKGSRRKFYKKPYFLCEYAHAMGVGAGDLEKYVNSFYAGDNMLGGCIWEFADHAVYHENEDVKYTYGGDHGEWRHDGNFCVDGLFYPDRTPHAGAYQMKNVYRPIRAAAQSENSFSFYNHCYFKTTNVTVKWQVFSDGFEIFSGEADLSIKPQSVREITLDYNVSDRPLSHNVILFRYVGNGEEIAFEQITLNAPELQFVSPKSNAPKVKISQNRLFIMFDKGHMIYNATTGCIDSYVYCGREMLGTAPLGTRGIGVTLFRAPLDNDRNICRSWLRNGLGNEVFSAKKKSKALTAFDIVDDAAVITNSYVLGTHKRSRLASFDITLTIYKTGKIRVKVASASGCHVIYLPRFGAVLEMPRKYENVSYFGLGPLHNLCDFNAHCHSGIFDLSVSEMCERYIKPQESSMRTDTRWAQVTDNDGFGLRFEAIKAPFTFGADNFTSSICAKAPHSEELHDCNTTCVHIDGFMMGAGSNSCGPIPSKESRIGTLSGKEFEFSIEPVGCKND